MISKKNLKMAKLSFNLLEKQTPSKPDAVFIHVGTNNILE